VARLDGLAVLVVEDHADSSELVRQMLTALGAQPMVAGNGVEGVLALDRARVDVILCDLLMPEMDGFTFIRQVRAQARWRDIPMIAVTALGDDADYRRTWEAGFDGHLTKPIEQGQLAAVIRAAVRARRSPES
jgi:two-component system, chemotaxis family, CheB/CheR fusion protein